MPFIFMGGSSEFLFGALIAVGGAVWLVDQPHWGVVILLVRMFIGGDVAWLPGSSYFKILYEVMTALLCLPLVLAILRDRDVWVLRVPQVRILLTIGVLFLLSTWWSSLNYPVSPFPEADETRLYLTFFVGLLLFLIFFLYFITTRRRIELVAWLVITLIIMTALNASYVVWTSDAEYVRANSDFSIGDNANRLGFACLFGASLLWFYRAHVRSSLGKMLILLPLVLLPYTALSTGSRSSLLQLVILTLILLKEQGGRVAGRLRALLVVGAVGFFVLSIVPSAQFQRATNLNPNSVERGHESAQNRRNTVFLALEVGLSNPIFGVGLGNFAWVKQAVYGYPDQTKTHNSYLWALVEGGVAVLILYLLLFALTYRMFQHLERWGPREMVWLSKGLKTNLILYLVFTVFADYWVSIYLYLFVGFAVVMTNLWWRQSRANGEAEGDAPAVGSNLPARTFRLRAIGRS